MGQRSRSSLLAACAVFFFAVKACVAADEPPANYYASATATDSTLKGQLKKIIDSVDNLDNSLLPEYLQSPKSYDNLRSILQITDLDPTKPFSATERYLRLPYNGESLNVASLGSTIPGWDNGATWNREHTWPQSRGLNGTGSPDGSDLHHLRAARTSVNGDRDETNFGGAFGTRPGGQQFGEFTVSAPNPLPGTYWYPSDADAGWVARAMFYMATRYDGTDANTQNLELDNGDVTNISGANDPPPQAGDLSRMIEWHFAATPDSFETHRNKLVFDQQNNRNPFIDHPEYVWPIFVGTANNSQISIVGGADGGNGGYTRNVDVGRVFVGSAVPAAQNFTLNKNGLNGTYFEVTATGEAVSSLNGVYNAFVNNQSDVTKPISIGLNPANTVPHPSITNTAGLKSGTVTVNNSDITNTAGSGRGSDDANDVFNVSLTVLEHARPSYLVGSEVIDTEINLGSFEVGDTAPSIGFDVFNYMTNASTADLDFDSFMSTGDDSVLTTDLGDYDGLLSLDPGTSHQFFASLSTAAEGLFSATYTLNFSDENIAGALNKSLTLTLMGEITAAAVEILYGDYNQDNVVDALDYTVWRNTYGEGVAQDYDGADGDGDSLIGDGDFDVWKMHYGDVGPPPGGGGLATVGVPEPSTLLLAILALAACGGRRRK